MRRTPPCKHHSSPIVAGCGANDAGMCAAFVARSLAAGLMCVFFFTPEARAQAADSARTITIPAPESGIIYIRAGRPGGVRIRSRNVPASRPAPSPASRRGSVSFTPADLSRLGSVLRSQGLDLELRLAERDGQDVVVLLRRTGVAADTLSLDEAAHLLDSLGGPAMPDSGASAGVPPLLERIERSILETGLFRSLRVNFEFDRSEILPSAQETIDAVADVLTRYPALRIEVAGHADDVGPDAYNERLSTRRAEAVRRYLIGRGIDESRVLAAGYGEAKPILSNDLPTGRAINRRVEFMLLNPEETEPYRRDERERSGNEIDGPDGQIERLRQSIRDGIRAGLDDDNHDNQ